MSIFKQFIMRMSLPFIVLTRLPSCVHEYLSTFNKKDGMWRGWAIAALRLLIKVVNYPYPLKSWWHRNIKVLFLQLTAVRKQTFFFLRGMSTYSARFQDRKLAQSPKVHVVTSCSCICFLQLITQWSELEGTLYSVYWIWGRVWYRFEALQCRPSNVDLCFQAAPFIYLLVFVLNLPSAT